MSWILHLSCFCLFSIIFCCSGVVSQRCHNHQSSLLLKLKQGFSFSEGSSRLNSWTSKRGSDCCLWEGVTCDNTTCLVIGLDLYNKWLGGGVDPSIFQLRNLRRLDLSNNYLCGPIHSSLEDLSQLVILDLSFNKFNGTIPHVDSVNIVEMDLSHNELSGDIPPTFSLLLKLTALRLSNNKIKGIIPPSLFTLPYLQTLDISENQIQGSLPRFNNRSLPSIDTLDLSHNMLEGPIPSSITHLTRLELLSLSDNNLNGTINFRLFQNMVSLSSLDLSNNGFTGHVNNNHLITGNRLFPQLRMLILSSCNINDFPWFLSSQTNLIYLDLSNNKLHGDIPGWIWSKYYGHLNLSHNLLTGIPGPVDLTLSVLSVLDLHSNMLEGSLPIPYYATILDYSDNRFTSTIPKTIGFDLRSIEFLSLSGNKFTGEIPPSICIRSSLKVLDLSSNNLNGSIPKCMTSKNTMSVLSLRGNNLEGTIPDNFGEGNPLKTLDLSSNRLSGLIPRSLVNCTMLEVLDLGNNHLHDTFPSWLGNSPQLRVLVLKSNQLHGFIELPSHTHQGFQTLQIIDLSSNKFTGYLPARYFQSWKVMMKGGEDQKDGGFLSFGEAGSYNGMEYYQDVVTVTSKGQEMTLVKILSIYMAINLSNNKFRGHIPEALGNLRSLRVLNLSMNNLDGQIPASLGNLSQIESLDLSHNNLSGEIPTELAGLYFLEVLDLSRNKLTGRIPSGTQFSTFSNASFEGNSGLCGPPLLLECATTPVQKPIDGRAMTTSHGKKMEHLEFLSAGVLGFVIGMGIVVWPLLFFKKWRRCYYVYADRVLWFLQDSFQRG